jgi:hypothetical protein
MDNELDQEYTDEISLEEIKELEGNPLKNDKAMLIIERKDGNYRGFAMKGGKLIQARAGDPNAVVTMLITHP